MESWIKNSLSDEQQKPFEGSDQNTCIFAAAGSGKTRTLVHLIANDLASGISASEIIAFTFTEKAASELLARIHSIAKANIPGVDLNGIFIGTIHSWCFNYLTDQSDFYNFEAIDELHVDALASRLYDYLEFEKIYIKKFPKAVEKFLADLEIYYNENVVIQEVPDEIRSCVEKFVSILEDNRLITFGGMIRHSIEHLSTNGPLETLKRLYVDEYQDVNPAQVLLIKRMLPSFGNVTVVGDDLQCIYNWRGSDVGRILRFEEEFNDSATYRLSYNYRSRPQIVRVSNFIAENVSLRDHKKVMIEKRPEVNPQTVYWLSHPTEDNQLQTTVDIINKFVADGVPFNKIAILLRSVLSWGKKFVDTLNAENIPVNCPLLSRGGGFIDTFLLPILEWIMTDQEEPKNEEEEKELELKTKNLWRSAISWGADREKEGVFWESLNDWWDIVDKSDNTAYDVRGRLYDFLSNNHILIDYTDNDLMIGIGIASQIIRSVEEIHRRRIAGHSRRSAKGVIREVFYALIRNKHKFGESLPIDTRAEGVLVSTVHQAKGLEWPIVILPMLVNGRFPVRRSKHGTSFPDSIAARYGTSHDDERRLFYVAFTRAKERLFLTDPCLNDKRRSCFFEDINRSEINFITDVNHIDKETWKINQKDLRETDPPPISIGLTDLLLFLECPFQFALRRVTSIQPSIGDDLGYGKGLHEVIQRRIEEGKPWSEEEIKQQVDTYVHLPYTSEQQEKISKNAIARRVQNLEKLGVLSAKVDSEVPVEVLFNKGIVRGIVDCIQRNHDGSVYIRDWKSSLHEAFLKRYVRQLQFYSFALKKEGWNVSGADIVDVKSTEEQNQVVSHLVDISAQAVEITVRNIDQALTNISENQYPPNPNDKSCSCCDMKRICEMRCDYE